MANFKDDLKKTLLKDAYLSAIHSPDPSTQNSAVLYDECLVALSRGINRFYTNNYTKEMTEKPEKLFWIEHAERSAIFKLINTNKKRPQLMVCPWAACTDCARAIIFCGIKDIITHYDPCNETRFGKPASKKWLPELKKSMEMFKYYGIKVHPYDGKVFEDSDNFEILFGGNKVKP